MAIIEQLSELQPVKIRFRLEFQEPILFEPQMIWHWRKELQRGARRSAQSHGAQLPELQLLLDPAPADDPYARKLFQKPSPPFIIDPSPLRNAAFDVGDCLELDVLFPGGEVSQVVAFATILTGLGELGLFMGEGRFELAGMACLTPHEGWQTIWRYGEPFDTVSPVILQADWLLEGTAGSAPARQRLRFVTPGRLLRNNRPLYHPSLADLFPFVLRRVTSVLYACSRIELAIDPAYLLAEAAALPIADNRLQWQDWRNLERPHGTQGVGGVSGLVEIDAVVPDDLQTLLQLAKMFHIGKGASYGNGCFVVEPLAGAAG